MNTGMATDISPTELGGESATSLSFSSTLVADFRSLTDSDFSFAFSLDIALPLHGSVYPSLFMIGAATVGARRACIIVVSALRKPSWANGSCGITATFASMSSR